MNINHFILDNWHFCLEHCYLVAWAIFKERSFLCYKFFQGECIFTMYPSQSTLDPGIYQGSTPAAGGRKSVVLVIAGTLLPLKLGDIWC